MSYSSKSEHPADLIPNPCKIPAGRLGAVGCVSDPSCAGEGRAGRPAPAEGCVCVGAQKGSRSACVVFSAVVRAESSMDELEPIVASFALGSSCCG